MTNKWSEIAINKSPIYLYTLGSGLCFKNCKLFNITKFTLVLPTFRLRLQSIYCLFHASFALKTGAVSREEAKKFGVFLKKSTYILPVGYLNYSAINWSSSNHCVRRPFQKQPWCILRKKIFNKSYSKFKGKWPCRRIISE